jgi:pimeloyl-ACP methyl ester carboxylesterase
MLQHRWVFFSSKDLVDSPMQTIVMIIALVMLTLVVWSRVTVAKALSRHPPLGIFVPVSGGRLHLRDMGPQGAPPERTIVMLHGASCNHLALTLPLGALLATNFRIIAIDRPGHGHSERPGGRNAATPTRQADLICEAMTALGIPKAIILAHSLAGALGTTLAMDHPERVAGLVLLGPATHPWPGGLTWYYYPASWPVIGWLFSQLLPVPGATLTMQSSLDGVFAPQIPPPDYAEATALGLMLRPESFMANAQDMTALLGHVSDRCKRYGEIRTPTVIISGDADKTVSTAIHTQALGRELPDVTVHILQGVGHVPHHAAPQFVVDAVEALSLRLAAQAR